MLTQSLAQHFSSVALPVVQMGESGHGRDLTGLGVQAIGLLKPDAAYSALNVVFRPQRHMLKSPLNKLLGLGYSDVIF